MRRERGVLTRFRRCLLGKRPARLALNIVDVDVGTVNENVITIIDGAVVIVVDRQVIAVNHDTSRAGGNNDTIIDR